jgi:hypothetical protein
MPTGVHNNACTAPKTSSMPCALPYVLLFLNRLKSTVIYHSLVFFFSLKKLYISLFVCSLNKIFYTTSCKENLLRGLHAAFYKCPYISFPLLAIPSCVGRTVHILPLIQSLPSITLQGNITEDCMTQNCIDQFRDQWKEGSIFTINFFVVDMPKTARPI